MKKQCLDEDVHESPTPTLNSRKDSCGQGTCKPHRSIQTVSSGQVLRQSVSDPMHVRPAQAQSAASSPAGLNSTLSSSSHCSSSLPRSTSIRQRKAKPSLEQKEKNAEWAVKAQDILNTFYEKQHINWSTVYGFLCERFGDKSLPTEVARRELLDPSNKWRNNEVTTFVSRSSPNFGVVGDHQVYSKIGRVIFFILRKETSVQARNILFLYAILNSSFNLETITKEANQQYAVAESATTKLFVDCLSRHHNDKAENKTEQTSKEVLTEKLNSIKDKDMIVNLAKDKWIPVLTQLKHILEMSHSICGAINYLLDILKLDSPLDVMDLKYLKKLLKDKAAESKVVKYYIGLKKKSRLKWEKLQEYHINYKDQVIYRKDKVITTYNDSRHFTTDFMSVKRVLMFEGENFHYLLKPIFEDATY